MTGGLVELEPLLNTVRCTCKLQYVTFSKKKSGQINFQILKQLYKFGMNNLVLNCMCISALSFSEDSYYLHDMPI